MALIGRLRQRGILWGGLIAAVLDITYAFAAAGLRGRSPMWVLQSIASGLLGRDAFQGGFATAALGGVLHVFIACSAAAVYHVASRRLPALVQHAVLCGLLYGVVVYLFMNVVVLPLAFPFSISYPTAVLLGGIAAHMVLVGLPISLANRRYSGGILPI